MSHMYNSTQSTIPKCLYLMSPQRGLHLLYRILNHFKLMVPKFGNKYEINTCYASTVGIFSFGTKWLILNSNGETSNFTRVITLIVYPEFYSRLFTMYAYEKNIYGSLCITWRWNYTVGHYVQLAPKSGAVHLVPTVHSVAPLTLRKLKWQLFPVLFCSFTAVF